MCRLYVYVVYLCAKKLAKKANARDSEKTPSSYERRLLNAEKKSFSTPTYVYSLVSKYLHKYNQRGILDLRWFYQVYVFTQQGYT